MTAMINDERIQRTETFRWTFNWKWIKLYKTADLTFDLINYKLIYLPVHVDHPARYKLESITTIDVFTFLLTISPTITYRNSVDCNYPSNSCSCFIIYFRFFEWKMLQVFKTRTLQSETFSYFQNLMTIAINRLPIINKWSITLYDQWWIVLM